MNEIHIIMEPKVMEYGSLKMAMIPWINQENYDDTMKFIKNCQADWCGAHLELDGFEMIVVSRTCMVWIIRSLVSSRRY